MIGLPSPNANAKPTNQNAIEPEKNKKLIKGVFVKNRKGKRKLLSQKFSQQGARLDGFFQEPKFSVSSIG